MHEEPMESWTAPDGTVFPLRSWLPDPSPKALLLAVHGLSGAADDFIPLGEILPPRGFAVAALNLRGQGLDPAIGRRGNLGSFEPVLDDIEAFVVQQRDLYPGIPLFLYGESMGAMLLVQRCKRAGRIGVTGLVLASPVVDLNGELALWQRSAFAMVATLLPWLRLDFGAIGKRTGPKSHRPRMTRDAAYEEKLRTVPHRMNRMTLRFLRTLFLTIRGCAESAPQMAEPVLILAAGKDVFIRPDQVERFFEKIGSKDKTLSIFPEAHHLLLHDWDRPEVEAVLTRWLDDHLQAPAGLGKHTACTPCK